MTSHWIHAGCSRPDLIYVKNSGRVKTFRVFTALRPKTPSPAQGLLVAPQYFKDKLQVYSKYTREGIYPKSPPVDPDWRIYFHEHVMHARRRNVSQILLSYSFVYPSSILHRQDSVSCFSSLETCLHRRSDTHPNSSIDLFHANIVTDSIYAANDSSDTSTAPCALLATIRKETVDDTTFFCL